MPGNIVTVHFLRSEWQSAKHMSVRDTVLVKAQDAAISQTHTQQSSCAIVAVCTVVCLSDTLHEAVTCL